MTPYMRVYGKRKDVSKFRASGCEHIYATYHNTSGYKLYVSTTWRIVISNQVRFGNFKFPYRKQAVIDQNKAEILT
jgi:hypothetical protein